MLLDCQGTGQGYGGTPDYNIKSLIEAGDRLTKPVLATEMSTISNRKKRFTVKLLSSLGQGYD